MTRNGKVRRGFLEGAYFLPGESPPGIFLTGSLREEVNMIFLVENKRRYVQDYAGLFC